MSHAAYRALKFCLSPQHSHILLGVLSVALMDLIEKHWTPPESTVISLWDSAVSIVKILNVVTERL